MCFSATASFTASATLIVLGTLAVRKAQTRAELPFAFIPVLFGIQQGLEGALWVGLHDHMSTLSIILTYAYSFFSHVLWPIYVPLASLAIEPAGLRRKVIAIIAIIGIAVGLYLLGLLLFLPITARVVEHHISYDSPYFYAELTMALYLLATSVSLMVSSHARVAVFGIIVFLSSAITYIFYNFWFISVWCFFSALMSAIVLWQLMAKRADEAYSRN